MSGETRSYAKLSVYSILHETIPPTGGTYNEAINVLNISGPNTSKSDIEVTHLQSTAKEFISDLPDPGELTFTISYDFDDTQHQLLRDDANGVGNKRPYKLEFVDPADDVTDVTAEFIGECMDFGAELSPGQQAQASVRVKISGAITYT